MDLSKNSLTEIAPSVTTPYRCYVKGLEVKSEGLDVHTVGFKDGLAVVQVVNNTSNNKNNNNIGNPVKDDNNIVEEKKPKITAKLKQIIIKTDPETGKKFVITNRRNLEYISKINTPNINLKLSKINLGNTPINNSNNNNNSQRRQIIKLKPIGQLEPPPLVKRNTQCIVINQSNANNIPSTSCIKQPPALATLSVSTQHNLDEQIKPNIIIKKNSANHKIINELLKSSTVEETRNITRGGEPLKYHVLNLNVKKAPQQEMKTADKNLQTDNDCTSQKSVSETSTQTEPIENEIDLPLPPLSDTFMQFFFDENEQHNSVAKKIVNVDKMKAQDMVKYSFFQDMRNALNFDRSGNLPIHESVLQNNLKLVKKNCLVLKALRESVDIRNENNFTPLHLAIIHNAQFDIIKTLIENGADVSLADSEGNTALHLVIEHNRKEPLDFLLQTAKKQNASLDVFNYEGFTPLILAVLNKSHEQVQRLLYYKADPNVRDKKSGRTALFHAAEASNVDLVTLLIRYHADTKLRNFFGTSPHEAMFEIEDLPIEIKYLILGREHQRFQQKKKLDSPKESSVYKKPRLQTTAVLRRVDTEEFLSQAKNLIMRKK